MAMIRVLISWFPLYCGPPDVFFSFGERSFRPTSICLNTRFPPLELCAHLLTVELSLADSVSKA